MQRYSIGPTWETDPDKLPLSRDEIHQTPDGFWIPKPTRSLGFAVIVWGTRHILQPDGPDKGGPFTLTPEQTRFVLWWYAVRADGTFVYPSGMFMRMKGAGKDPVGAFLCLVELLGPCRFGGWRTDGTPLVVPHPNPWVAVTAVSQEQTGNTMKLLPHMVSDATREKFGIEAHKEIWHTTAGTLQAFASSFRALEGKRTTFVLMNETHHWVAGNSGHDMAETIEDNGVKSRDGASRTLAITNAHVPGHDSVCERMWDGYQDWLAGRLVQEHVPYLVDTLQAPPDTDLADDDSLRAGIRAAMGDAHWMDIDRIIARVRDPRVGPSRARRMYLNQVVAAEDAYLTGPEVEATKDTSRVVTPGEAIVVFFDGSKNDDSTVLVGCTVEDDRPHLFVLGAWERPLGPLGDDWQVDREAVDLRVREVMREHNVVAFWGDVVFFESYHDMWARDFGPDLLVWAQMGRFQHATAWDMRGNQAPFTAAVERFGLDIAKGDLTWDGDPRMRSHFLNARRRPNKWGWSIGKEHRESPRKIDLTVAAVGALMLRRNVLASPHWRKRPGPPGVLIGF